MNTESKHRLLISGAALLVALGLPLAAFGDPHPAAGRRLVPDERYHHDHYYPHSGTVSGSHGADSARHDRVPRRTGLQRRLTGDAALDLS